ncbi:hypothetical protein [Streptomyces sp. NPDC088557]|uniref:hypothetical protein n=1 Tax=Streptomyces sp. NPDC088557 TaxID=3365867 RepID=UPI0037F63895
MNARATGAGVLGTAALLLLGAFPSTAAAAPPPSAPTPELAASAPGTVDTLSRFFAQSQAGAKAGAEKGAAARTAATPRVEDGSVPVSFLSPDFVAGKAGAPVARVEFRATRAVAPDGRKASLWTVRQASGWQVVNIATGDDEIRYAEQGGRLLPGGLVFREPQIDAWYVQKGTKVLPLDEDAVRAVGRNGTTLAAYGKRVAQAYGDKLPGSAYAKKGAAGGYDPRAQPPAGPEARAQVRAQAPAAVPVSHAADTGGDTAVTAATAGAGAALALALAGAVVVRRRRAAAGTDSA